MVVSKTYSIPPQGEVLSTLDPSTSYYIVAAAQTVSGAIVHSNPMTMTTLRSGECLFHSQVIYSDYFCILLICIMLQYSF